MEKWPKRFSYEEPPPSPSSSPAPNFPCKVKWSRNAYTKPRRLLSPLTPPSPLLPFLLSLFHYPPLSPSSLTHPFDFSLVSLPSSLTRPFPFLLSPLPYSLTRPISLFPFFAYTKSGNGGRRMKERGKGEGWKVKKLGKEERKGRWRKRKTLCLGHSNYIKYPCLHGRKEEEEERGGRRGRGEIPPLKRLGYI